MDNREPKPVGVVGEDTVGIAASLTRKDLDAALKALLSDTDPDKAKSLADIHAGILAREEAEAQEYNLRASRVTRQRRRAEVREMLMRINEWPKNPQPRKIRRKNVLGSVASFMKANPVEFGSLGRSVVTREDVR